jgi:hypothetical protein
MLGLDYSSDESDNGCHSNSAQQVAHKVNITVAPSSIVSSDASFAASLETVLSSDMSLPDESLAVASSPPVLTAAVEGAATSVFYSAEEVNPATIERCKQYLALQNFDLTESIRSKKDFGNPHILDVVVEHFKIDEVCLPHMVFASSQLFCFAKLIFSIFFLWNRLAPITPRTSLILAGTASVTTRMAFDASTLRRPKLCLCLLRPPPLSFRPPPPQPVLCHEWSVHTHCPLLFHL